MGYSQDGGIIICLADGVIVKLLSLKSHSLMAPFINLLNP